VQFEWNLAAVDYLPLYDVWDCPVATSCRGSDLNVYPLIPALAPYARGLVQVMERAEAVHCVSERLGREALAFGLDPAKARIIHPAVDPHMFQPRNHAGRPSEALRLVSVGAMRWEKGYEYALAAVRHLVSGGVPVALEIIGAAPAGRLPPSPEQQRIAHTVHDMGLSDHVRLCPRASPAELGRRLAAADALLHASLSEGLPNVVLEAMACGIPVVTTDCGAVREAVTDGVEGYVVEVRDPGQLAAALKSLWCDAELRARMGRAGRRRVQEGFELSRQIEQFLAMYEELAS
jgi:colanic acid/amylovoran biosynthesis glycosyltransferase